MQKGHFLYFLGPSYMEILLLVCCDCLSHEPSQGQHTTGLDTESGCDSSYVPSVAPWP